MRTTVVLVTYIVTVIANDKYVYMSFLFLFLLYIQVFLILTSLVWSCKNSLYSANTIKLKFNIKLHFFNFFPFYRVAKLFLFFLFFSFLSLFFFFSPICPSQTLWVPNWVGRLGTFLPFPLVLFWLEKSTLLTKTWIYNFVQLQFSFLVWFIIKNNIKKKSPSILQLFLSFFTF